MNINNLSKAGIIIASLCAASSVLAATPTTGVTNISGKLVASTCVVTIPTTYTIPAFTVQQIGAAGANGELDTHNSGNFKFSSCTGVKPWITLNNDSGNGLGKGADQSKGLFTYDHKPAGAGPEKTPLMFSFWLANAAAGGFIAPNINGTGAYPITDNLFYRIYVYRFGNHSAEGYQGGYRTHVTMTVNYS